MRQAGLELHRAINSVTNNMMNVDTFVTENAPVDRRGRFELENSKLLDIEVDGRVVAKAGSMIAYDGDLSFTGKSSAEGGITGFLKSQATNEGTPVMEVQGEGHVYLADQGKQVQLVSLDSDDAISVNGDDVLAFEESVEYEIGTIGSIGGAATAGLTNVFLSGPGVVALTTHGEPVVVSPPIQTDPNATVAWSKNLSPSMTSDRSFKDSIGQQSGETYQLAFDGAEGFVVTQPFEEVP